MMIMMMMMMANNGRNIQKQKCYLLLLNYLRIFDKVLLIIYVRVLRGVAFGDVFVWIRRKMGGLH
jgi:hypothetical protein